MDIKNKAFVPNYDVVEFANRFQNFQFENRGDAVMGEAEQLIFKWNEEKDLVFRSARLEEDPPKYSVQFWNHKTATSEEIHPITSQEFEKFTEYNIENRTLVSVISSNTLICMEGSIKNGIWASYSQDDYFPQDQHFSRVQMSEKFFNKYGLYFFDAPNETKQ